MAKQTINIGSGELAGDGESLRSAFDKINDNFDEVYAGTGTTLGSDTSPSLGGNLDLSGNDITGIGNLNITGNITASTIDASSLTGALPALDGSALTGVTVSSLAFANVTGTPTTIAGYGITDAFDGAFGSLTGTPTTLAGYGITDATSNNNPTFTGAVDFTGATSVDFTGATITGTSFLTSYTETDPVVGAITGLVKSDGAGNISAAVAGTDYLTTVAFADLTGTPTTLAGYGITDAASSSIPDGTINSNFLAFGDNDDLKIFHNGSSSIITETNLTSSLILRSYQDVRLSDAGGTETMLKAISHGAVELYHNDIKKLETSADGVAVTGKITGLTDPTAAQDAATKAYVDANSGGGGGSGLQSRGTVTGTTSSLADAAEADLDITGFKSYALLAITTDRAARVRLYVTSATRTADASRAEGVDPTSDAGLIAEVITTGADTVIISPGAFGFNLEGTPTTTIPCRVTNKSGGTSTVQVDLNILQLEA